MSGSSASYILKGAQQFLNLPEGDALPLEEGPSAKALELLRDNRTSLAAGETIGEQLLSDNFGLWSNLMRGWPMQDYANMTVEFLQQQGLLTGLVIELGAGVGTCNSLVADHIQGKFIRTELQPFLLRRQKIPGEVPSFNFDYPRA